ncbi:AI-2E family transporter [Shigella flexneri]
MDVRFAFVWGLLAFALNYIPNIGWVLVAIPPIVQVLGLAAFTMRWWFWQASGHQLVFGNSFEPRIMGVDLDYLRGGCFVVNLLGLAARPCWDAAFCSANHHGENRAEQTNGGQSIAVLLERFQRENAKRPPQRPS